MSRCFPYPPPGYERTVTRDAPLIESIKLQKGEKAKKETKNKKHEKKERSQKSGEIEKKKHSHKRRHKDKRCHDDHKEHHHQKRRENEMEQLEKSSLTEEHGHPVGFQNLCDSSDSTLNSNKRQKLSSPPDSRLDSGSILRIRLPFQRHKDPEVLSSKEQPCSASVNTDASVQEKNESARPGRKERTHACSTSATTAKVVSYTSSKEMPCSSSTAFEILSQRPQKATSSSVYGSHSPYLFENWVAPSLQSECAELDDQEWLFTAKQNHNCGATRLESADDHLDCEFSTAWSSASYLPEADIYALPFTVIV